VAVPAFVTLMVTLPDCTVGEPGTIEYSFSVTLNDLLAEPLSLLEEEAPSTVGVGPGAVAGVAVGAGQTSRVGVVCWRHLVAPGTGYCWDGVTVKSSK
jgi:hypothetical protein